MPIRILVVLLAAALVATPLLAQEEPNIFIAGIWPDQIIFFDQTTDVFTDGMRLRHGAATSLRSTFTPDRRLFFVITDRMETVEVVDPVRQEVVDELKLSTPGKRIRISRVAPNREGTKVYLTVNVMRLEPDRFIQEHEADIMVYDLEARKVVDSFKLPDEMSGGFGTEVHVSPDGESLYIIARDLFELDAETREVRRKKVISKRLLAGYGELRGFSLTETEPGIFYGIYRTEEPVLNKRIFGVAKLDLFNMNVSTFELGPALQFRLFALSPDGKRGYAGLSDMVVIDMEKQRVILKKENFERGRANTSMIVGHDGTKLYVSGVGDTVWVYDTATLDLIKTVYAGGDFMLPPVEIPNPVTSQQ
jgi:DNA-binding beta-propeller fold protein YncE